MIPLTLLALAVLFCVMAQRARRRYLAEMRQMPIDFETHPLRPVLRVVRSRDTGNE